MVRLRGMEVIWKIFHISQTRSRKISVVLETAQSGPITYRDWWCAESRRCRSQVGGVAPDSADRELAPDFGHGESSQLAAAVQSDLRDPQRNCNESNDIRSQSLSQGR